MGTYSIKELAYLSGIKAHTIRIWEQRYSIITPERTQTNIRTYTDFDLRHLLNVSFLNHNGYKISKIAKLTVTEILKLVDSITIKKADYPIQINSLILAMVNLDEIRFNQVVKLQTESEGFERTAIHIILPFLERVGILWQTGDINPAQEHFISGLIRQKLIAAIDALPIQTDSDSLKFLLFLPEGEWHEIGLLFGYFLVKKKGFRALYLGQSLPLPDLENTVKLYQPQVLISALTSCMSPHKLVEYSQNLTQVFPDQTILLSGSQILKYREDLPKEIHILETIHSLVDYLATVQR